jgi:PAS domain S-box-containing protein
MLKRALKFLDVSVLDPEDARRRRLLNVLLVYIGACAFFCAILLIAIPTVLISDGGQAGWGLVLSVVVIIVVPVLYILNRRASGRSAQWLFMFFLLVIILLIYDPGQNLRGRGLLLFSLPIFLSSLLLRSWASFPMAAFSSLVLTGLSYQTGRPLPSLLSFVDFFFLASVAWLSARGLERAAKHAGQADGEIALLAKFPSENPNPVLRIARDGILLYANEAALVLLADWKLELGKTAPEALKSPTGEVFETQTAKTVEITNRGRTFSFAIAPAPKDKYVNLYGRDVTEQKQTRQELQRSEEKYHALFQNAQVGMYRSKLDSSAILAVNRKLCEIFEYSEGEMIGNPATIRWADPSARERMAADLRKTGALLNYEIDIQTKNGNIRTCSVSIQQNPELGYIEGSVFDITERRRAEEGLRDSEEKYRLIADNANDWIYLTAPDRTLLYTSPSCERVTGYTPKEFTDDPDLLSKIIHPDDRKDFESHTMEAQGESRSHNQEFRILTKSGETRWISHSCVPVQTQEDQYTGRRGTNRDITERRRVEDSLKNTLVDLDRSNKELEQFANVASHDLQEPLRMVSSYTQLLARRYKGKLDKDADEFIDYAVDGANTMQRLINDLLSYSRVGTRGKPPEPVSADMALDRALENLKLALEESQAEVKREPLPTVKADDVQLIQVFQNLIANAIKFRGDEPPRIFVACQARGREWVFSVRDNGIGIDPQYLERIFIIFQRLHQRGKYPGTGMGLAICKKVILRLGGRIWAESKPGEGSTFFFTLPRMGGQ